MAVMTISSEEERLEKATNQLLRFFNLPVPENTRSNDIRTVDNTGLVSTKAAPAPTTETTKSCSKSKKVHWKDINGNYRSNHSPDCLNQGKKGQNKPPSSKKSTKPPPYKLPPPPKTWPQHPLLIRATPGSSTQIVGIRQGNNRATNLHDNTLWGEISLPINTGGEKAGESIVVDFISNHFVGSVLIRIKGVAPCDMEEKSSPASSYFDNRQRTFQGVVRGRFRNRLAMMDCVTGQTFQRPAGTLPAHWIVSLFEALIQRLAPHNQLHLEGTKPRSLSPLVTTAQTIQVHRGSVAAQDDDHGLVIHDGQFFYDSVFDAPNNDLEQDWQEPHATHHTSLVANARDAAQYAPCQLEDSKTNQKFRKTYFNKQMDQHNKWKQQQAASTRTKEQDAYNSDEYCFTPDKEYLFEFYEHLVVFDDPKEMALDLRLPLLRHIPIAPCTDGQPIQIMGAVRRQDHDNNEEGHNDDDLEYLWSFEVWHESLYPYAIRAHERMHE